MNTAVQLDLSGTVDGLFHSLAASQELQIRLPFLVGTAKHYSARTDKYVPASSSVPYPIDVEGEPILPEDRSPEPGPEPEQATTQLRRPITQEEASEEFVNLCNRVLEVKKSTWRLVDSGERWNGFRKFVFSSGGNSVTKKNTIKTFHGTRPQILLGPLRGVPGLAVPPLRGTQDDFPMFKGLPERMRLVAGVQWQADRDKIGKPSWCYTANIETAEGLSLIHI